MACPFVAGCIALLLEAEPSLRGKPAKVTTYLKSTGSYTPLSSTPVKVFGIPIISSNYAYDTRDINPENLCSLTAINNVNQNVISDVQLQMFRSNGV